jgi:hypothetical protein
MGGLLAEARGQNAAGCGNAAVNRILPGDGGNVATALKTQRNRSSVKAFLDRVPDERRRKDARAVSAIMKDLTGEKPAMWGTNMVGFGSYHYRYRSGQEGDWPLVGFSPRKDSLTLYIMPGFRDYGALLAKLGRHKKGVSCLYITSLDDVHLPTLKTLVRQSVKHMKKMVEERASQAT